MSKQQPARWRMSANHQRDPFPCRETRSSGVQETIRKIRQDVQYAAVVQRQTLDHRIRRFRWRRPRDRGLQWWWLIHDDEGCPWRG